MDSSAHLKKKSDGFYSKDPNTVLGAIFVYLLRLSLLTKPLTVVLFPKLNLANGRLLVSLRSSGTKLSIGVLSQTDYRY